MNAVNAFIDVAVRCIGLSIRLKRSIKSCRIIINSYVGIRSPDFDTNILEIKYPRMNTIIAPIKPARAVAKAGDPIPGNL